MWRISLALALGLAFCVARPSRADDDSSEGHRKSSAEKKETDGKKSDANKSDGKRSGARKSNARNSASGKVASRKPARANANRRGQRGTPRPRSSPTPPWAARDEPQPRSQPLSPCSRRQGRPQHARRWRPLCQSARLRSQWFCSPRSWTWWHAQCPGPSAECSRLAIRSLRWTGTRGFRSRTWTRNSGSTRPRWAVWPLEHERPARISPRSRSWR